MNWSSLNSVGRTIVHLAIVALFVSGMSFAAVTIPNPKSDFTFQQITEVATPSPTGAESVGEAVYGSRGVMLQAQATFVLGGKEIDPAQIKLSWETTSKKQDCLRLSYGKRQLDVPWPEEEIFRVAYWVATSKSTTAFTFLPKNRPVFAETRRSLLSQGFVETSFSAKIPDLAAVRSFSSDSILVHGALNSQFLVNILGYVDFADSSQKSPWTEDVVSPFAGDDDLVASLNKLGGHGDSSEQPTIDFSYTNLDYGVQFSADFSSDTVQGAPIRLYWSRYEGPSKPFYRAAYQFVDVEAMSQKARKEFGEQQKLSIELYRLASIFRAFQMKNPDELINFVNQGLARRNKSKK